MKTASVFLLVEPSGILRSSLHDWLHQALADDRILVAANGQEALKLAVQEQPSHILLEMELPDKAGLDVLREMRQTLPNATIIATGWYQNRELLNQIRSAGADGFLRKHRLPHELLPLWDVRLKQR
jgi:DNA-binding NarL/FixJ family response regulator